MADALATGGEDDPRVIGGGPWREYHGPHVAPLRKEHDRLAWMDPATRGVRFRVREHTCCCRATVYEFCVAGGLAFIRRYRYASGGVAIHETVWTGAVEARRAWELLLAGGAR